MPSGLPSARKHKALSIKVSSTWRIRFGELGESMSVRSFARRVPLLQLGYIGAREIKRFLENIFFNPPISSLVTACKPGCHLPILESICPVDAPPIASRSELPYIACHRA